MSRALSREEFDARKPPKNNQFDGTDAEDLCVTIEVLAEAVRIKGTAEFWTEPWAADLFDYLSDMGW